MRLAGVGEGGRVVGVATLRIVQPSAPDPPRARTLHLPVRHPALLRPGPRGRVAGRPDHLRLPAGRLGRGALPRPAGPVLAEPAPRRRLERPVLRLRRTATPPRPARALRRPRHHPARHGPARGRRRHLPPGVVALHPRRSSTPTTTTSRSGGDPSPRAAYVDPTTGQPLPTWDEAMDELDARARRRPRPRARTRRPVRAAGRRPGRPRRHRQGRQAHRLPHQVPHQVRRRLPRRRHRDRGGAPAPAVGRAALHAVLGPVRELAALRHPAQDGAGEDARRALQSQGPPARHPRHRRPPGPRLPRLVRQDASPTTATTRPPGCDGCCRSASATPPTSRRTRRNTLHRRRSSGNSPNPATLTSTTCPGGCCGPSPPGCNSGPRSPRWPGTATSWRPMFRQPQRWRGGERHDQGQGGDRSASAHDDSGGLRGAGDLPVDVLRLAGQAEGAAVHPAAQRRLRVLRDDFERWLASLADRAA